MGKPTQQKFQRNSSRRRLRNRFIPELGFRVNDPNYPFSMITHVDLEEANHVPVFPVRAFRPEACSTYACNISVFEVTDEHGSRRYFGHATPRPELNILSSEELVPVANTVIKVRWFKGRHGTPVARDPETGAYISPSYDYERVLGQPIEAGEDEEHPGPEVEVMPETLPDGRCKAHAIVRAKEGEGFTIPKGTALVVYDQMLANAGMVETEYHRWNIMPITGRGKWKHLLEVLGIPKSRQDTYTLEEIRSAYRQVSRKKASDLQVADMTDATRGVAASLWDRKTAAVIEAYGRLKKLHAHREKWTIMTVDNIRLHLLEVLGMDPGCEGSYTRVEIQEAFERELAQHEAGAITDAAKILALVKEAKKRLDSLLVAREKAQRAAERRKQEEKAAAARAAAEVTPAAALPPVEVVPLPAPASPAETVNGVAAAPIPTEQPIPAAPTITQS